MDKMEQAALTDTSTGRYVPPFMREGARKRRGCSMATDKKDAEVTIRVSNMSCNTKESDLQKLFKPFKPSSIKIVKDKLTKKSKGLAFIRFHHRERADKAISGVSGCECDQRILNVVLVKDKANHGQDESERKDDEATIIVSNLAWNTKKSDLKEIFKPFGPISNIYIVKDKITKKSKGYAIIKFPHHEDAANAISEVSGCECRRRVLKVYWAKDDANDGQDEFMASDSEMKDDEATIKVSNLSLNTKESDLEELFKPFKPITSIYIVKDKITKKSKGYAIIKFPHHEDAAMAISEISGCEWDQRILKVYWTKDDANDGQDEFMASDSETVTETVTETETETERKDDEATIKVSNLSRKTKESDLEELFKPFEPISSIYIIKDKITKKSKGYAFIKFTHREDARKAFAGVSGCECDQRVLNLEWVKEKVKAESGPGESIASVRKCKKYDPTRIKVTNLPQDARTSDLIELFKPFGPMIKINLTTDHVTKQLKGFATIIFLRRDDAAKAIEGVTGYEYNHQILSVEWGKENVKADSGQGESIASVTKNEKTRIKVTNLSLDANKSDLKELFKPFGPMNKFVLATDRATGQLKGFATIVFRRREDAVKAIAGVNGYEYNHQILNVEEWIKRSYKKRR